MKTHLLFAFNGINSNALASHCFPSSVFDNPPLCLKDLTRQDGVIGYYWDLPTEQLVAANQILPSFSCLATSTYGYQFALEWTTATGKGSYRTTLDPIGPFTPNKEHPQTEPKHPAIDSCIDFFRVNQPLLSARLLLAVDASFALDQVPALLCISIHTTQKTMEAQAKDILPAALQLDIPAKSQMLEEATIARHVCSPTSVSMVLDYYGRSTQVHQVISAAQHRPSGLYGVWPANIYAASRWGILGYLLAFSHWDTARRLLAQKIPLIASVQYNAGELSNAAIAQTTGHLLVISGYDADNVYVNDPAANSADRVKRQYDLTEFKRIWLDCGGIAYVLLEI